LPKKFLDEPFPGVLEGEVGSTGGKGSIMGGGDN